MRFLFSRPSEKNVLAKQLVPLYSLLPVVVCFVASSLADYSFYLYIVTAVSEGPKPASGA